MNVLFLGESAATRAPLGEALGRHAAAAHGWWSAGLKPTRVHPEVRRVLAEEGVTTEALVARGLGAVPCEDIDVVVVLGRDLRLPRSLSHARVETWLLPDPASAPPREQAEAFRAARDELRRRIRGLVA